MTAPTPTQAAWFLAGMTTGEHLTETLGGRFADGYDAGHADGLAAGYVAHAAELEARHAALWAELRPRLDADAFTAHNRAASAQRWAERFGDVVWDADAEHSRCLADWSPLGTVEPWPGAIS